ncbi:MAG: AraC family transcriptional regulator [Acutalibacteraceae bacterium]|nr:AraC family transcriptional regulator [Acutalibacteraceae bacterium]
MQYSNFSYDEHIDRQFRITAHKKSFSGNTGIHFHEFFEIELILSGDGSCMINGTQYPLSSGALYILTPADFHFLRGDTKLQLYNIMFDESMISEELAYKLFNKRDNRFVVFDETELNDISGIIELIIRERNNSDDFSDDIIKSFLSALINIILRKLGTEKQETQSENDVSSALRYIYTHLRFDPSLAEVAKYCGYSTNYFGKRFHEFTGKKYKTFINEMKLSMAKRMLMMDNITVQEISNECGFSSVSNFYRVFKENVGIAPKNYRKSEVCDEE